MHDTLLFGSFVGSLVALASVACGTGDTPLASQHQAGGASSTSAGVAGVTNRAGATGTSSASGGMRTGSGGASSAAAGAGAAGNHAAGGTLGSDGGAGASGTVSSGGTSSGGRTADAGATSGGANTNGGRGGRNGRGGGGASSGGASSGGAGTSSGSAGTGTSGSAGAPAGFTLAWSDEFDGPSGQSPDASKWAFEVGGDGWGNNELEYYTNRTDNSATDGDGHLVITLKAETYMNRSYTSARLKTQGLFTQAYGRFEARIKIPRGQGVWPAFWMLGDDIATNVWPNCGEIDIMENAGKEPTVNHGSLHGPGYSGGNPLTGTFMLTGGGALADDFHVYAVEWETNTVRFYVDGNNYETRKSTDVPAGDKWVYDHPFFMLLNVAIGGAFGGTPDTTTMLPQTMTVDYVRVYTKS